MRTSMMFFFASLAFSQPAVGKCYQSVIEFAEGICAEFVGLSGEAAAEKYSGQLGASLEGLIRRLAELEGDVDVEIAQNKYNNVLQEDVPQALRDGRECRLEVAKVFFDKLCPTEQSLPSRTRNETQTAELWQPGVKRPFSTLPATIKSCSNGPVVRIDRSRPKFGQPLTLSVNRQFFAYEDFPIRINDNCRITHVDFAGHSHDTSGAVFFDILDRRQE